MFFSGSIRSRPLRRHWLRRPPPRSPSYPPPPAPAHLSVRGVANAANENAAAAFKGDHREGQAGQEQAGGASAAGGQSSASAILSHVPERRGGPGDLGISSAVPPPSSSQYKAPSTLPVNPNLPANPMRGQQHNFAPQSISSPATSNSGFLGNSQGAGSSTMSGLYLGELHWWTSDEDIVNVCAEQIFTPVTRKHVYFSEHKVNGKSKGLAFISFSSPDDASRAKAWFDANEWQGKRMSAELAAGGTNPFKTLPKG
ncbi:hypothetical protein P7C70_g7559, partial [Phenoliferia sp. Uapishka_3]